MKAIIKLRLNSYLIIIFAIVFIGAAFFLIFELQKSQQKQRLIQEITWGSFQLISLQNEYFLHPSERPKNQWGIVYQSLLKSIDEGMSIFTASKESSLFKNTFLSFDDNKVLFEQIVGYIEQGKTEAFMEQKKDILSVKAQERVSKMLILSELGNARSISFWYFLEFIIIILACVIGAISVFSYKTSRSISKSLHKINRDTKIIAGGNLNYTLDIKKKMNLVHSLSY